MYRILRRLGQWFLVAALVSCGEKPPPSAPPGAIATTPPPPAKLAWRLTVGEADARVPALRDYRQKQADALASPRPVVRAGAADWTDPRAAAAVAAALRDPRFVRQPMHPDTGEPLLHEILDARPATAAERAQLKGTGEVFRVELYNFFFNQSTLAWVAGDKVFQLDEISSQPPAPGPALRELAGQLALAHPDVRSELGLADAATPPPVTVNAARMERSRHLGACPVFRRESRALSVLVDLTETRVVGWQWSDLAPDGSAEPLTERSLQNEAVMAEWCDADHTLERDGWKLTYRLTSSDGLEIRDVTFQGKPVLRSARLVEWHVSYQFNGGYGYTDAMGCPMFSSSKVVALEGPAVEPRDGGGFTLVQDFRSAVWPAPCNYRYQNQFEFHPDGRFRVVAANLGRGCQPGVWYRPVLRVEFPHAPGGDRVERWDGAAWQPASAEFWHQQPAKPALSPSGALFRLHTAAGVHELRPGGESLTTGDRPDEAFTFVSVHRDGQPGAEPDLPNLGDCCRSDHQQGPHTFITPSEPLAGQPLVLWYVPQFQAESMPGHQAAWADTVVQDGRAAFRHWPARVGPTFAPVAADSAP